MGNSRKDWFNRVALKFEMVSPEPFSQYMEKCLAPLLRSGDITPPQKDVYRALDLVPFDKVRIVILGQDPAYQVEGKVHYATGLAFALNPKIVSKVALSKIKGGKSLREIFRAVRLELKADVCDRPDTSLESWAEQGVLLLNTALTTQITIAGAHRKEWRLFVAALILALNTHKRSLTFVLTCNAAKDFLPLISSRHKVFFNYKHPSRCWRVYKNANCTGTPIRFFQMAKNKGINWKSVFLHTKQPALLCA